MDSQDSKISKNRNSEFCAKKNCTLTFKQIQNEYLHFEVKTITLLSFFTIVLYKIYFITYSASNNPMVWISAFHPSIWGLTPKQYLLYLWVFLAPGQRVDHANHSSKENIAKNLIEKGYRQRNFIFVPTPSKCDFLFNECKSNIFHEEV